MLPMHCPEMSQAVIYSIWYLPQRGSSTEGRWSFVLGLVQREVTQTAHCSHAARVNRRAVRYIMFSLATVTKV